MASGEKLSAVLMGGMILGVWLFGLLFGFPGRFDVSAWAIWGLMGIVVAGAVYAARAASETTRLVLVSLIGAIVSMVLLGAALNENIYALATLTTIIGGILITAALPAPRFEEGEAPTSETDGTAE